MSLCKPLHKPSQALKHAQIIHTFACPCQPSRLTESSVAVRPEQAAEPQQQALVFGGQPDDQPIWKQTTMANKSTAAERRAAEAQQNPLPAQAQQHMASLTESAASLYRSIDALQQVNQHAAQRAALKLQQAAEQLRGSENPAELLSIQSTLMLGGVQDVAQYFQEVMMTLVRVQSSVMKRPEVGSAWEGMVAAPAAQASSSRAQNGPQMATDATTAATVAVLKSWSNLMGAGFNAAGDGRGASH